MSVGVGNNPAIHDRENFLSSVRSMVGAAFVAKYKIATASGNITLTSTARFVNSLVSVFTQKLALANATVLGGVLTQKPTLNRFASLEAA